MAEKIIITSESICDLGEPLMERYGCKIIPLGITLGDKIFRDTVDIFPDMIYEHVGRTGELPKTTAANVQEYTDFFSELTNEGYSVIHCSLSSEFSSTYNNARIAASEFENVYVVDSKNLSTGAGLVMLTAADMVKSGMSAKEITEKLNEITPCVDASFVIDSLEYLHKGGRCSALSVLGANLLKLKPCIEVKNGVMGVGKKYRGKLDPVVEEYVKDRLSNIDDIDKTRVFITHAGGINMDTLNKVVDMVTDMNIFDEVFFTRAGCTISSHCGPYCMGILFVRKTPIA